MTLPLAHLGHYLWIFYVIPVLIVVGGIIYSSYAGRRDHGSSDEGLESSESGEDAPPAGGTGREAENEHLARRRPSP